MPSEAMNHWFRSRKPAQIENILLKLRPNPILNDMPLSTQQGQAEVFFLKSDDDRMYVLKRFHEGKQPDTAYIKAVSSILPPYKPFLCGTMRKVLNKTSLAKSSKTYFSEKLAAYLKNAVLMPKIEGLDWNCFLEQIRDKKRSLTNNQRLALCNNLAQVVRQLERHKISHRDLSGGNVFIDPSSLEISLIDFDSLYHPSLKMPKATTVGSEGYTASFITPCDAQLTYRPQADRFALTILCTEFLLLNPDSPFSNEGGIFCQDELNKRSGATVKFAQSRLKSGYSRAYKLFQRAIRSNSFNDCPKPDDWIAFSQSSGDFVKISSMPKVALKTPVNRKPPELALPDDPWKNSGITFKSNSGLQISRKDPFYSAYHLPLMNENFNLMFSLKETQQSAKNIKLVPLVFKPFLGIKNLL